MEIKTPENFAIDWENIQSEKMDGLTGFVMTKTIEFPTFKIRQLSFSKSYEADHWCEKGHIIYVIKGELIIEYIDGSLKIIPTGSSCILGDNISSHKVKTQKEAQILIID